MFNLFNLFKKKVVIPVNEGQPEPSIITPTELIAHANSIVDGALLAFNTAVSSIERANEFLNDATKTHSEQIFELEKSLVIIKAEKEQATININVNLALKEKLMQFVK
jgi:hypothetical protein